MPDNSEYLQGDPVNVQIDQENLLSSIKPRLYYLQQDLYYTSREKLRN